MAYMGGHVVILSTSEFWVIFQDAHQQQLGNSNLTEGLNKASQAKYAQTKCPHATRELSHLVMLKMQQ